jgi:hypothetical protein
VFLIEDTTTHNAFIGEIVGHSANGLALSLYQKVSALYDGTVSSLLSHYDAAVAASTPFTVVTSFYAYGVTPGQMTAFLATTPLDQTGATEYTISPDSTDVPTFTDASNGNVVTLSTTPVCFAEGALILTADGECAVEGLAVGDLVITASGEQRAIKWIGQMTVRPSRRADASVVNPIRIKAGAFGEGLPVRDLRVSPGHAIYVEGVLIPAGHLVNGATIVQEEVESVRYFHVELESHDVLLAEGLPCESYLDDGNRFSFANAGEAVELYGRLDPQSWANACAPMVAAGPQLEDVQRALHARAEAMGWIKTDEADLTIEANGTEIAPLHSAGNRFWFAVPAADKLTLRSNANVLAHVMPGIGDGRKLGVAISDLRINGTALSLDDLSEGFYPAESHEDFSWRWTTGAAVLPGTNEAAMVEVALHMVAPTWKRRAVELKLVASN